MSAPPPLLETYEEARLLLEAKGWGIAKAAEHLSEIRELARFHISHTKLSMKTKPGADNAIEPEVAAAVEGMETRRGYERQREIVIAGLLVAHVGRPTVGMGARLPVGQRAFRLLRRLAERFGRAAWKPMAIAGSGALVSCLALLVAPILAGTTRPGPLMVLVFSPAGDHSRRLDPRSLMDIPANWGEKPLDQTVPDWILPGQKVAPCDAGLGQVAIYGNCWANLGDVKPPCGRLFRQGDKCYAPVAEPKKPAP